MENQRTQNKVAMTFGAIYGLASIVVFMLFYVIGTDIQSKAPQYLSYLLLAIFIIMGVKSFRDQDLGGYISYSRSLGTGTLISLYGGIISGAFSVLFFMVIAPEMTEQIIAAAQENMAKQGLTEEQMQMGVEWTRKFTQPLWLFVFSIIGSVFIGFILSLLISVFLKKEDTPFNSNIG
ncbi:MAG: DUF4199 domain-containing protein [Bacteroidia bacterium]|nr:DUF4199 domain-containing protein [Bacteroidia bacterium]